ncbi:MAG: hypothetical protein HXS45_00005, partial [Theionarchaea archaeon]|nr:hypothetical protein [Theionarchaea archaeon]
MNLFRTYLTVNYLIVQALALVVARKFWVADVVLIESGNRPSTSLLLFAMVIAGSLLVLVLIKFKLSFLLYYFTEYVGLFVLTAIMLSVFINFYISLAIAAIAAILRYTVPQFKRVSVVILAIGIAALLGVSLTVYPVIIFLLLLSVYDVLAVRKTK